MRCRKIRKLIDIYLDNEKITTDHQEQLFAHIRTCSECLKYFEQTERMQEIVYSAPTVSLPVYFRSELIAQLETEGHESLEGENRKDRLPLFRKGHESLWEFLRRWQKNIAVFGAASAVGIILLFFALWYVGSITHSPDGGGTEPAATIAQALQIDVVSPHEDAVVEPNRLDISAAFYFLEDEQKWRDRARRYQVRILLDAKDVTYATEINEDYIIYTPNILESGHHLATIQLLDTSGMPVAQRSWAFYVLPPPSVEQKHDI